MPSTGGNRQAHCQFQPSSNYDLFWMISFIVVQLRQPQVDFRVSTIIILIFRCHHYKADTNFPQFFQVAAAASRIFFLQFFWFFSSCRCRKWLNLLHLFFELRQPQVKANDHLRPFRASLFISEVLDTQIYKR